MRPCSSTFVHGHVAEKQTRGDDVPDFERKPAQVADEIKAAVPVLAKLGIQKFVSVDEWWTGDHPGPNLVGSSAKELGCHKAQRKAEQTYRA